MKDIENLNDIQVFVYEFYDLVKEDQMLSPIFASRIADDDWGDHLKRMCDFWNTVLFFNKGYKGNPFAKHSDLPIHPEHFERWTSLFKTTIDKNFSGPVADSTKQRVGKMAVAFMNKIDYIKRNQSYRSIM